MFGVLEPLHAMMERGPQTMKETSFNQVFILPQTTFSKMFAGVEISTDANYSLPICAIKTCTALAFAESMNQALGNPNLIRSISFIQAYGRDLMEAQEWCRKYTRSRNVKDLTQAWDLYYHVFRRISKQLPQVSLSLN